MTDGISKETLLGINPWQYDNQQDLLNAILGLCAELDPWMTVDENTPKDKRILIKFIDGYVSVNDLDHITGLVATHYKLLK